MKKRSTFSKILSLILTGCILVTLILPTIVTIAAQIGDLTLPDWSKKSSDEPPSLNELTVPQANANPYSPDTSESIFPIYNGETYDLMMKNGNAGAVGTYEYTYTKEYPEGTSNYFTPSISPFYSYYTASGNVLQANLPYREGNANLFHPDLVLTNDALYVDVDNGPRYESLLGPGSNIDHVYVRVAATVVSGEGTVVFFKSLDDMADASEAHKAHGKAGDKAVNIKVDVPLRDVYSIGVPCFRTTGIMTDMHITLIDNTAPSVTKVHVSKSGSKLILKMTFNEGLTWSDFITKDELDKFYVEVLLKNTGGGKNQTLRMYVSELGGENNDVITFTGELGDYRYANFYIDKISNVGKRNITSSSSTPVVDVPDKMYYTPADYIEFDHNVYATRHVFSWARGTISDYAGNSVDLSAVIGRKLGQRYNSNSFEAAEVIIYNDVTLGAEEEKIVGAPTEWPEDIDKTHMFAGPDNKITVKLTTYTLLTEEEAKKVSIQLNIKNPDGTPLVASCTSS